MIDFDFDVDVVLSLLLYDYDTCQCRGSRLRRPNDVKAGLGIPVDHLVSVDEYMRGSIRACVCACVCDRSA